MDEDGDVSITKQNGGWGKLALHLLHSLWADGQRCDTTLVTGDNQTFAAHSTLLTALSPVLRSSFPQVSAN